MKTTIVHWMAKLLGLAIRIDGLPTGLLARREPLQQVLRDKPHREPVPRSLARETSDKQPVVDVDMLLEIVAECRC